MSDRLYEDVHSAEIVAQHSSELVVREEAEEADQREPVALEKGTRYRPDGTVEEYQRAEY